ncbi:MAG: hypothetical protein HY204_05660 [Nitrospirae bacterium]|nr:hypothetical protein [Nitrospirota bacterium]
MKRQRSLLFLLALILILSQREVSAQSSIPLMIPHSGTVTVGGTPFNGNGFFKFAIVNKDCTLSPVGAACATLWSNDNTLGAGVEPALAVKIPVTNGAFTVKLGDTALTNMLALPAATDPPPAEAYLRIWFNDGATGSQQLSPDRQLVSVLYAYHSETASLVAGTLLDQFVANIAAPNATSGYVSISSNYIPPVNARAFIWARCSYDGSAAGQNVYFRVAFRSPTGTGAITIGNSFYLDVHTAAANTSVMAVNFDFFNLTAGQSYDFGVNFISPSPTGGIQTDYCTNMVMIYRQ